MVEKIIPSAPSPHLLYNKLSVIGRWSSLWSPIEKVLTDSCQRLILVAAEMIRHDSDETKVQSLFAVKVCLSNQRIAASLPQTLEQQTNSQTFL